MTMVLLLYPTHYEILYWLSAMAYIFGLAFWSLSLGAPVLLQIVLQSASFMTSEMYILPALFLPVLISVIQGNFNRGALTRVFLKWLASLGIFFIVRAAVRYGLELPAYSYDLKFSPDFILSRISDSFFSVYAIYFYKIYWINTAVYWLLLIALIWTVTRSSLVSAGRTAAIFGISFLVTGIYWIYGHSASRALFGAQILICIVVFYFLSFIEWRKLKYFLLALFIVYASATAKILSVKWKNSEALAALDREWTSKLLACQDPCALEMNDLDKNIHGDWVVPHDFWGGYVEYVKNRHGIKKVVNLTYGKDGK